MADLHAKQLQLAIQRMQEADHPLQAIKLTLMAEFQALQRELTARNPQIADDFVEQYLKMKHNVRSARDVYIRAFMECVVERATHWEHLRIRTNTDHDRDVPNILFKPEVINSRFSQSASTTFDPVSHRLNIDFRHSKRAPTDPLERVTYVVDPKKGKQHKTTTTLRQMVESMKADIRAAAPQP